MEYLQYYKSIKNSKEIEARFKPCYKWNTFNTIVGFVGAMGRKCSFKPCYEWNTFNTKEVLYEKYWSCSFKPCYKWNTFNTLAYKIANMLPEGFKPCYKWNTFNTGKWQKFFRKDFLVLNLVISGIPSIQDRALKDMFWKISFKPCYKWNTFNTLKA